MFISMKKTALTLALAVGLMSTQAEANTVDWGVEGGPNTFDSATITFGPFIADTLVDVSGIAYFGTNNGTLYPVTFNLDILLNGTWTNIFSGLTTGTAYLDPTIAGISFDYGTVSGLRAEATGQMPGYLPMANWAVGAAFAPTLFNFDTIGSPPSTVPLPAGLPLLLAALGLFGLLRRHA